MSEKISHIPAWPWVALALLVGALLWVIQSATVHAAPGGTSDTESLRLIRPGYLVAPVDVTAAAATDSQILNKNAVYSITCTVAAWVDMGDSTVTAAASEHYVVADIPRWIRTTDTVNYIAAIRVGAVDGTCYLSEER